MSTTRSWPSVLWVETRRGVRPRRTAGTTPLLAAAVRRDRVMIACTLGLLAILAAGSDRATRGLYPAGSHIPAGLLGTMRNAAFVAMYGPLPQPTSIDAIGVSKVLLTGGLGVAILAQMIVRRHTRAEEESGLAELIAAQTVGRHAPLTAALLLAAGSAVACSVAGAAALVVVGAPVGGALDFGLCWVVIGLTGAGLAAVGAQVAGSGRGAGQFGLIALAVLYLVRMIGDTTAAPVSWLSPLGWASRSEPFGANHYWVIVPGLLLFAVLTLASYTLLDRRDLGAGLLPQRRGAAHGRITGNAGLVWRLLRSTVAGWMACFALLGIVVGSLTGSLSGSSGAAVERMLRSLGAGHGSLIDLYLATEISVGALIATAAGITVISHLATEERARRLDSVLASPVSRSRMLTPYVCWAFALPAGSMVVFTAVIGLTDRLTGSGAHASIGPLLRSGAATFPAMWATVAVSILLFGVGHRWTPISWAVLVLAAAVAQFGDLLSLPAWLRTWSPFDHLAAFPADNLPRTSLAALTVMAALALAGGITAYLRRDVE